jgi:hypothetical protein
LSDLTLVKEMEVRNFSETIHVSDVTVKVRNKSAGLTNELKFELLEADGRVVFF